MRQPHLITEVRQSSPLVHCITNIVVANFQANGLLALGASPIMADSIEEAADVASFSACTLLNIGTLNSTTVEAMLKAGESASAHGKPLILDPVGAGATAFRKRTVEQLLNTLNVTLIRGNAGEIAEIAGVQWYAKGIDAGYGDADLSSAARQVAKAHTCLVAVTGEEDLVTDGEQTIRISGGHRFMTQVTGSGCLLSAVAGAFLAVNSGDSLRAVSESLAFYKRAGEIAAKNSAGPGDFTVNFLNALNFLTPADVRDDQFHYELEEL